MKRKILAILLSVVIALSIAACARPSEEIWVVPDDTSIATLGDTSVSALNFMYLFVVYRNSLREQASMGGFGEDEMDEFWDIEQDGVSVRQNLIDETMHAAMEYAILYDIAIAAGHDESAEDAEAADAQIDTLLMFVGNDEQEFARIYHMTPDQMRRAIRQINVSVAYFLNTMQSFDIAEDDIRSAYDANPFAFPVEVTVQHILITATNDMSEEAQAEARELAEDLMARIEAGEDIVPLVVEYSQDFASIPNAGEYTFGHGVMVEAFEDWSFNAEVGDVGIVRTMFGYHVILKVRTPFENAISHIERMLRFDIFREVYSDLYEQVDSEDWVIDQPLLDMFFDLVS